MGGLVGCDSGPTTYEPLNLPAVTLTDVVAATSVTDGGLDFQVLDHDGGSSSVVSTTSFKLHFDRLLAPPDSNRQAVCLQPKLDPVVQPADCNSPEAVLLHPSYDPVLRQVTYYQKQGDQGVPLHPGRYALTAYVAVSPSDTGFVSFDGVPLATRYQIQFTVQESPGGSSFDVPVKADYFCGKPDSTCNDLSPTCVRSVSTMLQGCSFGGCHSISPSPDAGALGLASDDLEMGTVDRLQATAIGHPAHETQTGESGHTPAQNPLRFGRAMPIIDPYVPSDSYLIYKLLANHHTVLQVPFTPDPSGDPDVDPPEIARLRNELVVGMPMPPSTAQGTGSTAAPRPGEMEWLSAWILGGALTPTCQ